MTVAAVLVLAVVALAGAGLALRPERVRSSVGAGLLVAMLGTAAALSWRGGEPSELLVAVGVVLAVLAAAAGGGPVATAVLRVADPADAGVSGGPADPQVLRGGAWIGVLERIAVAATLLHGFGEGLAVVLAVKGLGRYAELRPPPPPSASSSAPWPVPCGPPAAWASRSSSAPDRPLCRGPRRACEAWGGRGVLLQGPAGSSRAVGGKGVLFSRRRPRSGRPSRPAARRAARNRGR